MLSSLGIPFRKPKEIYFVLVRTGARVITGAVALDKADAWAPRRLADRDIPEEAIELPEDEAARHHRSVLGSPIDLAGPESWPPWGDGIAAG